MLSRIVSDIAALPAGPVRARVLLVKATIILVAALA